MTQSLIDDVNALIAQGTLDQGRGAALLASLRAVLDDINQGNTADACEGVGAFIAKVQQFVNQRRLPGAQGQSLISSANDLRAALGCTGG